MLVIPDSLDGLFTKGPGNKAFPESTIEDAPQSLDPPPAYVARIRSPAVATYRVPSKFLNMRTSNHVSISRRNERIKQDFLVDPFMTVPRCFLLPLGANETEDDRPNLKLHTLNASMNVNIALLSGTESLSLDEAKYQKHTVVDLSSINGSITAMLRSHATPASGILIPFLLNVAVKNASITLGLPPDFEGRLKMSVTNGSIKPTDGICRRTLALTEDGGTQRRFVGDRVSIVDDWEGNEVNIEVVNGTVNVGFVIQ